MTIDTAIASRTTLYTSIDEDSTTDAASTTTTGASDASPSDATSSLTPDALLAYCQARLSSIDSQIGTSFGDQQARNTDAQGIQGVLATLQSHAAGVTDASSCQTMETSLLTLIQQIKSSDAGCPALPTLEQTYNNMVYSGTGPTSACPYVDADTYPAQANGPKGDNILSADEMTSYINGLQGCASSLDSGAELQMIQLQSLMSQRQTAISLTTNLVQALGNQASSIASNIGH